MMLVAQTSASEPDAVVEELIRGFVQGAPVAMWTQACRFELCVLQVDEGFNFFSIHQGSCDDVQCIPLAKVRQVIVGAEVVSVCHENGIFDDHLRASTGLAILHGDMHGSKPARRNICVFLVDTEQKQEKLRNCFETICGRSEDCAIKASKAAREVERISFAPPQGDQRGDGGRNSMGPFGQQRPSLGHEPSRGVPGVSNQESDLNRKLSPDRAGWQPPPGYGQDSSDEEVSGSAPVRRGSRVSRGPSGGANHVSGGGAPGRLDMSASITLDSPAEPAPRFPAAGTAQKLDSWKYTDSVSGAHVGATQNKSDARIGAPAGDASDEEDRDGKVINPYRTPKQDPSCSDRMCENNCAIS